MPKTPVNVLLNKLLEYDKPHNVIDNISEITTAVIAAARPQIEQMARAAMVEQVISELRRQKQWFDESTIRALAALPPTHQVVPVEPTEAMINAAFEATVWPDLNRETTSDVIKSLRLNMAKEYKAMLAASKGEA